MRNPFSPRAFVLLAIVLLAATALPQPVASQTEGIADLRDIRIVSVRPITKSGTHTPPWADIGWFPQPDTHIEFEVRVQVFQSAAASAAPVLYDGQVRIIATRYDPTDGSFDPDNGFDESDGCFDNGRKNVKIDPATHPKGFPFVLGYDVAVAAPETLTFRFETNKACARDNPPGQTTFAPCCQPGDTADNGANNRKGVTLAVGRAPDFGIVPMVCTSTVLCDGADRKAGGPGVTNDPSTASGVPVPAIRLCWAAAQKTTPRSVCDPLQNMNISGGRRLVYFQTFVSAFMQPNGWPKDVSELSKAVATEPAGSPSGHAGEKFLVYPNLQNQHVSTDVVPIQIPINFELYKLTPGGTSGEDSAVKLSGLHLADAEGAPVAVNCPDGIRRCVQWLADSTGGAPDYANRFTPVSTTDFDLASLGGDFELRAYLNGMEPANATAFGCGVKSGNRFPAPEKRCDNNVGVLPFRIKAPDLVVEIDESDLKLPPIAYETVDKIEFSGVIKNVGDKDALLKKGSASNQYNVRFLIDDRASFAAPEVTNGDVPIKAGESREFTVSTAINGDNCSDDSCSKFVPPGTRKLRVIVDDTNNELESIETNNEDSVFILVKDTQAPKLAAIRMFDANGEEIKGATPEIPRGARFNVTTLVTDTDHQITDVTVEFLRPNGEPYACPCAQLNKTSITRNDMWFATDVAKGLMDEGEWTITVRAKDPSLQVATPVVKKVKVSAFKKLAEFDYKDFVTEPCGPGTTSCDPSNFFFPKNGTVLPYLGGTFNYEIQPAWTLPDDPRDQHGFLPAWTSQGVSLRFEPPDRNWTDVTVENDKVLVLKSRFGNVVTRVGDGNSGISGPMNFTKVTPFNANTCVTDTNCQRRTLDTKFGLPIHFGVDDIGRYNVTLNVTDVGGASKLYRTSFEIRDAVPFANMTLRRVTTGANPNPDEGQVVAPGQTIRYRATGHDDQGFEPNGTIHLNFSHIADASGRVDHWVNVSMGKPTSSCARAAATPSLWDCHFEKKVKTGTSIAGAQLTRAGRWNLTIWSEDKYHNFGKNTTTFVRPRSAGPPEVPESRGSPLVVYLNDTVPARFNGTAPFGTQHPEEEVGGQVTFYARVVDDLDADVFLEVKEGSNIFADFVKMKGPDRYGNYTHNMTFDAAHVLEYRFRIVDSNATRSPVFSDTKTLRIVDNLPPRMDVLLPNVPDHGYFARAAPVLEFKVYDTAQGVNSASIQMTVDGAKVETLEKTLVENGHGFLVRYTRDPSRPWVHGQNVNVTLNASDLSVPPKTTQVVINFTVDAIAPKSRIVSFEPRYVAKENDLWNVSLDTRFTPTSSDDDDGLPTGVTDGGIRYQFIRSGPGKEFVYNGTSFPMSDLPATQNVGNAEYFVRVLGTDVVGNKEIGSTSNTLRVFLDQVPPELVRSKLKTTGRVINATFDDPASGTKAAKVHYRYDSGAFATIDMVKAVDGTWTTTIPSNPLAKNVAYYLEATDNVGNRKQFGDEQSPPWSFAIGNQPPSITITAPANGQTVSGSVTLRWEASDPDRDQLTFRVYYKPTGGRDELELTTLSSGTQSYVLNTVLLGKDGQYDVRVTASDGNFFEESTVRIDVVNAKAAIDEIVPDRGLIAPGEVQCIRTRITKADVSVVEAIVYLDGREVARVPLADNGRGCDIRADDGIYGGAFTPEEAGMYDVEIFVRYIEAGEPKETTSRENGLFEVKLGAVDVIGKNPVLFGAFITLGAAVFAVGGFAVYRRWK